MVLAEIVVKRVFELVWLVVLVVTFSARLETNINMNRGFTQVDTLGVWVRI